MSRDPRVGLIDTYMLPDGYMGMWATVAGHIAHVRRIAHMIAHRHTQLTRAPETLTARTTRFYYLYLFITQIIVAFIPIA